MSFEKILIHWLIAVIMTSLILGGTPWKFPGNGKYWIETLQSG